MSAKSSGEERRQDPRVDNNIPIKLYQDDGDLVTETANISRSGIYCKVNKRIEPMTKMKVQMLLPIKSTEKKSTKKIVCEGIVVRSVPIAGEELFNIAIFFNSITQRDAEAISEYISAFLKDG